MLRLFATFWLCLAIPTFSVAQESSDKPGLPEAAEMFERLVERIPANTDPIDMHKFVGKPFNYVYHGGNARDEEIAIVPFVVADRLYLVHVLRTAEPELVVYSIERDPKQKRPVSQRGQKTWDDNPLFRKSSIMEVLDWHAVIDHGEKCELPFTGKVIHRKLLRKEPKSTAADDR